ncbi:MAG: membrane dipeptidase [Paracoccaceae bacterium]|jgi:membrane dipeptidase
MSLANTPLIFDGHNDVLNKLFKRDDKIGAGFAKGYDAHIDLPKAKIGGFGGGFFAIWIPSTETALEDMDELMRQPVYDLPLPSEIQQEAAATVALQQAAILAHMQADGLLDICTSTDQIRKCLAVGKMAAILHIEGAEAIDTGFEMLEVLYRAGLRSLGPVWSRPTAFGHGVPFKFPSTGDVGAGLTNAGKDLVRRCNHLGIMLDMSHLNEAGFWDVVNISDTPIVATHSNAHAICPSARNLTDGQLAAIKDSDGLVGVNFATAFLRPDGQMREDTSLELVARHLDHLIEHLGEDRVAFGSDFDGAMVPAEIKDAGGLTNLRTALRKHGYNEALMARICHENWLRVLALTWHEKT